MTTRNLGNIARKTARAAMIGLSLLPIALGVSACDSVKSNTGQSQQPQELIQPEDVRKACVAEIVEDLRRKTQDHELNLESQLTPGSLIPNPIDVLWDPIMDLSLAYPKLSGHTGYLPYVEGSEEGLVLGVTYHLMYESRSEFNGWPLWRTMKSVSGSCKKSLSFYRDNDYKTTEISYELGDALAEAGFTLGYDFNHYFLVGPDGKLSKHVQPEIEKIKAYHELEKKIVETVKQEMCTPGSDLNEEMLRDPDYLQYYIGKRLKEIYNLNLTPGVKPDSAEYRVFTHGNAVALEDLYEGGYCEGNK